MAMVWSSIVHTSSAVARRRPLSSPTSTQDSAIAYTLRASCPLPCIDCVTTVKTFVFRNPRHLQVFNRFNHIAKPWINASLVVGCITASICTLVDVATGRVLGIVSFVLMSVPLLLGFIAMCIDLNKLLVKTYEFWFILVSTGLATIPMCLYLGDARSLVPIVSFVWYARAFMVDASCSGSKATTLTLAIGAAAVAVFMLCIVFQLIPATYSIVLFRIHGHVLGGEDVALNGLGIVLLLLCRNAYRNYTTAPRRRRVSGATAGRVRLMGYRTRIQYVEAQELPGPGTLLGDTKPVASDVMIDGPKRKMSQLISAAPTLVLHARHVLWLSVFDLLSLSWTHTPTWILSRSAIVLNIVASALHQSSSLAVAALVTTAVYWAFSLALCNRSMLGLLLQSFDVQFLMVQHSFAHLTAAFIVSWDKHCLLTLTYWLWVTWLVLIDAFTPIAKRKLAISRPFLAFVFVKLLFEQCLTAFVFVFLPFENRAIFSLRLNAEHNVVVKAIPFFLTRTFAMFWWTWRLLWRVYSQHPDELVVIQGGVEFDDYELYRKRLRQQSKHKARRRARGVGVPAWS